MTERSRTLTWTDPLPTAALTTQLSGIEFLNRMINGEIPATPIMGHMNMRLVHADNGSAVLEATPDDSLYNNLGVVHAGFAMTLLDSAAACAVHTTLAQGWGYTSLETKVSFLRGVTSSSGTLVARGWVSKPGKRAAFGEADLRGSDGTLYATASSTCAVFQVETQQLIGR